MGISDAKIAAGPAIAIIVYMSFSGSASAGAVAAGHLSIEGAIAIAIAGCMAWWWLTEAVPVAVTALMPMIVCPILGLVPLKVITASYAHPLIFLFFGGFLVSIAIEKWSLHSWVSARIVSLAGSDLRRLIGAFMLMSALASMWISNTATAIMMLPIAAGVIHSLDADSGVKDRFATCLMLGIAYAASIGGTATLIGSPPNLFVASFLEEQLQHSLTFGGWMMAAFPVALFMLPVTWWLLTRFLVPVAGRNDAAAQISRPPPWRELPTGSKRVATLFVCLIGAWIFRPLIKTAELFGVQPFQHLNDTIIAMTAGLSLFLVSAGKRHERLLVWDDIKHMPFGTLILFGGGLALASTISATGADHYIGHQLSGLRDVPHWISVLAVVAGVVFLTELTSNTATTTTLAPILAAAGLALAMDVPALLMVTALAASAAFMMPVATPPNAIVYASGHVSIATMARAGLAVNLIAILVIVIVAQWWLPLVVPSMPD